MHVQCNSAYNCVVVKNFGPMVVENIIKMPNHDLYFVCNMFGNQNSLFSYPLDSTSLNILKHQVYQTNVLLHLSQTLKPSVQNCLVEKVAHNLQ
jgi:hypothetical protein